MPSVNSTQIMKNLSRSSTGLTNNFVKKNSSFLSTVNNGSSTSRASSSSTFFSPVSSSSSFSTLLHRSTLTTNIVPSMNTLSTPYRSIPRHTFATAGGKVIPFNLPDIGEGIAGKYRQKITKYNKKVVQT